MPEIETNMTCRLGRCAMEQPKLSGKENWKLCKVRFFMSAIMVIVMMMMINQARGYLGETLRPPKVFSLKGFSTHWALCLDHGKVIIVMIVIKIINIINIIVIIIVIVIVIIPRGLLYSLGAMRGPW